MAAVVAGWSRASVWVAADRDSCWFRLWRMMFQRELTWRRQAPPGYSIRGRGRIALGVCRLRDLVRGYRRPRAKDRNPAGRDLARRGPGLVPAVPLARTRLSQNLLVAYRPAGWGHCHCPVRALPTRRHTRDKDTHESGLSSALDQTA